MPEHQLVWVPVPNVGRFKAMEPRILDNKYGGQWKIQRAWVGQEPHDNKMLFVAKWSGSDTPTDVGYLNSRHEPFAVFLQVGNAPHEEDVFFVRSQEAALRKAESLATSGFFPGHLSGLRSAVIHIAASLPQGDLTRRKLLHLARRPYMDEREDIEEQQQDLWMGNQPVPQLSDLPRKKLVVLNRKHGGFGLSKRALNLFSLIHGTRGVSSHDFDWGSYKSKYRRHDPALIWVVETLGNAANGPTADLELVPLKSGMYFLTDYDGAEGVTTPQDIDWIKF